jgi:hypothetical protein
MAIPDANEFDRNEFTTGVMLLYYLPQWQYP